MGKITRWKCDGCDTIDETVGDEIRPKAWREVEVLLKRGDGLPVPEIRADLCEVCDAHLQIQADPRQWPRAGAADRTTSGEDLSQPPIGRMLNTDREHYRIRP